MIFGLFLSFFLIAPEAYFGLNAGAIGLVWKQIIVQFLSVSILGYIISRDFECENLIYYQIKVLVLLFAFNYFLFYGFFFLNDYIIVKFILNGIIYFPIIAMIIYRNYKEYNRLYKVSYAWTSPDGKEEVDE